MRLFGPNHKRALTRAQDLWDLGRQAEAISELETVLPRTRPTSSATDAFVVCTLATYVADMGDPERGLDLLSVMPLDGMRPNDVQVICLGARSACRARAGDLAGARSDRDRIVALNPVHPALVMADFALMRPGTPKPVG